MLTLVHVRGLKSKEKHCLCVFLCECVCSLTHGRPPLLGLHGQRANHSPHVCCCRRGNKCVWMLKSVCLWRHVSGQLERTLPRPRSFSSHPLLLPLNGCSWQKNRYKNPLSPSSLCLCFLTPTHYTLFLSVSLAPFFFHQSPSLPVLCFPSLSVYIYHPPTLTLSPKPEKSIRNSA